MSPSDSAYRFREEHFPYVVIEVIGRPDEDAFDAYLSFLTRQLQRPEKRFLVLDCTELVPYMSKRMRDKQADWQRRWERLAGERMLGLAFIVPNPIARVAVRALMVLQPPGCDWRIVKDRAEALAWAEQAFTAAGDTATVNRLRQLGAAA